MSYDIEGELRTFILADATVAGILGTSLYPDQVPSSASGDYCKYEIITDPFDTHHGGASALAHTQFQITGWSPTNARRRALKNALRVRLHGHQGDIGTLKKCAITDIEPLPAPPDEPDDGTDKKEFKFIWSFTVWHQRP